VEAVFDYNDIQQKEEKKKFQPCFGSCFTSSSVNSRPFLELELQSMFAGGCFSTGKIRQFSVKNREISRMKNSLNNA